jgi:hypothetical protein
VGTIVLKDDRETKLVKLILEILDLRKKIPAAKSAEGEKKTNFMDNLEIPKDVTITAWYTPETSKSRS